MSFFELHVYEAFHCHWKVFGGFSRRKVDKRCSPCSTRGSISTANMELEPKNHTIKGFWDLIPYWQSKWTLWVIWSAFSLFFRQVTETQAELRARLCQCAHGALIFEDKGTDRHACVERRRKIVLPFEYHDTDAENLTNHFTSMNCTVKSLSDVRDELCRPIWIAQVALAPRLRASSLSGMLGQRLNRSPF